MADPFEDELVRRHSRDPFAVELARRQKANATWGETLGDVAMSGLGHFNKAITTVATAPFWMAAETAERARQRGETPLVGNDEWRIPDALTKGGYMAPPEPKTTAGKFAGAVGETLGYAALPEVGLLAKAPQMARWAAQIPATGRTVTREMAGRIAEPFVNAPGRAVAADAVAATGAGLAQEAAKEGGFGPAGQSIAGMAGALAPAAVMTPFNMAKHQWNKARAGFDPHAKVANALGEQALDDLSTSAAVGVTNQRDVLAQRVIDTWGEEMVRANGNRQAAHAATLARLEAEGGVTAATAREQLRRVGSAQADNELMLGEYPAVMQANENTRGRTPEVLLRELDTAGAMPNRETAQRHRVANDPGRVEDAGTHWMMDTVANAGAGPSSAIVRNSISDRLQNLRDQARARIASWAPRDPNNPTRTLNIDDAEAALNQATQAGRQAYRNVYDPPGGGTAVDYDVLHPLLARTVDRHLRRLAGYSGDQADALRTQIDRLYLSRPAGSASREALPGLEDELAVARAAVREARRQKVPKDQVDDLAREAERIAENMRITRRDATPSQQQYLMPTLEQLQNMRSAIRRDMSDPARPDLAAVIGPLYRDLTRIMQRSSPQWRVANRQWADLELRELAQELGQNLSERAGPLYREQMRTYRGLAPEARRFVDIEFTQALLDKIANTGVTDDLAKLFKTPHVREMVRTILGGDAAVDMLRLIRDNQVATKSKNMMAGSPTQPRQARQAEMNADLGLLQAAELPTTPQILLSYLKKYTIDKVRERRNTGIARILTTPMRDTPTLAMHLERMRQARAQMERYARPPTRAIPAAQLIGDILSAYGD